MEFNNLVPFSRTEIDKLEIFAGIYAILNQNNDMIYVGESVNIRHRMLQHYLRLNRSYAEGYLYIDYHKFKRANFFITILEEIQLENLSDSEAKRLLKQRERHWIEQFDCEKSYNNTYFQSKLSLAFKSKFHEFIYGDRLDRLKIVLDVFKLSKEPLSNLDFSDFELDYDEFLEILSHIRYIQESPKLTFKFVKDTIIADIDSDRRR